MVRPKCPRQVNSIPGSAYFKPRGVPVAALEEVVLGVDEFEAIRLADYEGLYQEAAAERMGISRPTFGRILVAARRKTADALLNGKALKIAGGAIRTAELREFRCASCGHQWELPFGTGRPPGCPSCGCTEFRRKQE